MMNKAPVFTTLFGLCLSLTACSKLPAECEEAWTKIETIAQDSGIPADAIKTHKKEFEEQIQSMSNAQAIQTCTAQSSALGFIK